MPRQLHWGELTAGITAAVVIAGLVVATLLFARVGALHGKKVTLYVVTNDVSGVLAGTEVWLAGKKVGLVKDVSFLPPSADTSERLLIKTEFLGSALPGVRRDSYASVRPGGRLIGTPVVYIAPGTATSPPLNDGDTVHARHRAAIAGLAGGIATIAPEISALASQVKELNASVKHPVGTVGNYRMRGLPQMAEVSDHMSRITAKATRGSGTIGLATRTHLMARATHAMAAADSIQMLLSSNRGSIGRFRRDTTLITKAKRVLAEVDTLRALVSNPVGTIADAHPDSTLTKQLNRTHTLLESLISNIKSHPLRYINF